MAPRALSVRLGHLAACAAATTALAACAHSDDYVVVTVDARAAVHDARSLTVTLSNAGAMRSDSFTLQRPTFPVTFSVSAPGRTGELGIAVDATDAIDDRGSIVGHGSATAKVTDATAHVLLDATDFVVNTDYAGDQFPSSDFEAAGFQLAALPDGTWTVAFRDSCPQSACSIFARRFDHTGVPATTQAAAGTNPFVVSARTTDSRSMPAIASSRTSTAAIWDFYDATTSGIACRAIDASGALNADQIADATDAADVASIAPTADDNFIATWKTVLPSSSLDAIRAVLIKPDCTAIGAVQTVAQGASLSDVVHRGSVASSADHVLFAWITNGDLHTRMMSSAGAFTTADTPLVLQTATERIEHARVAAATGGGFVIAARWVQKTGSTGPGRIDLFRISPAGAVVGTPVLVSDRSGSSFNSSESFAMTSRTDGTVLIAWHSCTDPLDDSTCDVFGRIARDTGDFVTDLFPIPTTTAGAQLLPSVVGIPDGFVAVWADGSHLPPDTSMQAVRARIIYPP
jgi:hypothetical protein